MGGKSSSSNQTTTTNVSGQNAISGDNLGTAISGVNQSTINVTATDYGAIENAFAFAGDTMEGALAFAGDALDDISAANSENLQTLAGLAGNQAEQNRQNLDAVMELAKFKQDNGASENRQQQIVMFVIIALILGAVAVMALKKR
ncbi:chemotaxis protein [Vibrio fluvialis]|uniref:chemotaxis protein n=1 Tax=Vibrio fluvialis TaxID=676 RepID=UPI0014050B44|nr:chemotaxis protein [Vibrio fluvialis]EKO3416126.1 chemotaxis protein [Vibrio fluvialis]EKO3522160.1 chemotaxis protein [Vibrio fluvialis]EKO3526487.1 chemotaxis protein [Vibrio fluvialis]EKO3930002.1 chemotaxis protein [Vibrio fluvialis]EKO4002941.1 chemotaxis protein [Vibrio fluvialis]